MSNNEEWIEHFRTRKTETLEFVRTFVYPHLVELIDDELARRRVKNVFNVLKSIGY